LEAAEDADGDAKVLEEVVFDFTTSKIRRPEPQDKPRYKFRTERRLIEHLLFIEEEDWVNHLFLSARFSAKRIGQYNEFVYTFFKCLTDERVNYVEGWYAEQQPDAEDIELDGWVVQRRCPHLKADLTRFGEIEGDTLQCLLHGWKFDLESGRCLTSAGHEIRASRVGEGEQ
jgi:UDP-MurNAc hydroxylase